MTKVWAEEPKDLPKPQDSWFSLIFFRTKIQGLGPETPQYLAQTADDTPPETP
jgi:hypothetical protein